MDEAAGEVAQPVVLAGDPRPRESWESGFKDTVIAYPGEVTRIRAQFKKNGQYVWHCHIVEHEDNEMMRPYRIGPVQPVRRATVLEPVGRSAGRGLRRAGFGVAGPPARPAPEVAASRSSPASILQIMFALTMAICSGAAGPGPEAA